MDGSLTLELLAILVLILANGFFALAEFSVIASRKSRLRQKAEERKSGAQQAAKLRENPERFLATIQVGITLVAAMVGVFSGATMVNKLAEAIKLIPIHAIQNTATGISMVLVVVLITVLSVVLGELVPKYLALSFPERYARYVARPISFFVTVTSIFSRLLSGTALSIVRMLGVRRDSQRGAVTEEEINQLVIEGREEGVFDDTQREFIRSVFEFADSTVRRAMTPRTDVIGIDIDGKPIDIVKLMVEQGYSRYPVFKGNIDTVVGVIYAKDVLQKEMDARDIEVDEILREALYVPDSMPLSKLLREFQKGKNHMAIVLDDFGGTAGIITLEDILEELVGEIQDEYDTEAKPLVRHSDTVAFADSSVWPGEVNDLLNSNLPEDDVDTLAGLFMEAVGRLPEQHETVTIADVKLTVLAKDENRILRIKAEKIVPESTPRE